MTTQDKEFSLEFSRRKLLAAAGIGGSVVLAPYVIGTRGAAAAPDTRGVSELVRAPPVVAGLHLQFGGDASSEIVVSWHTLQPVRHARVLLGLLDGKLEQTVEADETSYTDAKSEQVVYVYHAKLGRLQAGLSVWRVARRREMGFMSALGHKRTSAHGRIGPLYPPKAGIS